MKKSAMLRWMIVAILLLAQSTGQVAQAATLKANATAAYAVRFWVFDVTIQGYASGNYFQRRGTLVVSQGIASPGTINGANPYEVALVSGSPIVRQEVGAINYTTNTTLFSSPQRLDMAYVSYDRGRSLISVTVDQRIAATGMNVFNASNSLLALYYTIKNGHLSVSFRENSSTIAGSINVSGPALYSGGNGSYIAQFQGRLVRTGTL